MSDATPTADLKQQVREAVERLRRIQAWDVLEIADDLESAAAAEPEYEVRWTYGDGGDGYDIFDTAQRAWLHTNPSTPGEEHTVRRVFIEPIPPKPEPELSVEEAVMNVLCHRVGSVANGLGYIRDNDESREAIEALARALARERGA